MGQMGTQMEQRSRGTPNTIAKIEFEGREAEHRKVLQEIIRAAQSNGRWAMDWYKSSLLQGFKSTHRVEGTYRILKKVRQVQHEKRQKGGKQTLSRGCFPEVLKVSGMLTCVHNWQRGDDAVCVTTRKHFMCQPGSTSTASARLMSLRAVSSLPIDLALHALHSAMGFVIDQLQLEKTARDDYDEVKSSPSELALGYLCKQRLTLKERLDWQRKRTMSVLTSSACKWRASSSTMLV